MYTIAIRLYAFIIWVASFFSEKAKLWINGRTKIFEQLKGHIPTNQFVIWIHCASLGEFEQGRPLIEAIKEKSPNSFILLTFFSPSGYEIRKDYELADFICYLPADTKKNAKQFIQIVQPSVAIFVKYEFWKNYLQALKTQKVPAFLISAIFHPKQPFFGKWYSSFFQSILQNFDYIFVQNQRSARLLQSINIENYEIAGDTRIDRVIQLAEKKIEFPVIEAFKGKSKLLICGSTWQPDEAILAAFINQTETNWKYIFAPHDISESHIQQIEARLNVASIRYSSVQKESNLSEYQVLIIDSIGILSQIYRYGTIAYIGGGFGVGIHNTLEPAAFHLPIVIGPKYQKFEEANHLVKHRGIFVIESLDDFKLVFKTLQQQENYNEASKAVKTYIDSNQGATDRVMERMLPLLK